MKAIILLLVTLISINCTVETTLKATHFWDCSGAACDSATLQPWDPSKYRYAPEYAPMDPTNALYGEKIWMTGAASNALSSLLGSDDGCCGQDGGRGGCGKCLLVTN